MTEINENYNFVCHVFCSYLSVFVCIRFIGPLNDYSFVSFLLKSVTDQYFGS